MPRVTKKIALPQSFVTIDASTQSLAFALIKNGKLIKYGKIKYDGSTLDDKLKDISQKTYAFFTQFDIKIIVIEDTVYINSPQTVTMLSKCQGALLAAAYLAGVEHTYRVSPIAWQSYIGTRLLTDTERKKIKAENPGKSASWYKSKERTIRKHKTIATVNKKFDLDLYDDDIADACGLAMFCLNNWNKVMAYGKK